MSRRTRVATILLAEKLIITPDAGALRKIALEQVKNRIELPTREFMEEVSRDILNAFGEIAKKDNIKSDLSYDDNAALQLLFSEDGKGDWNWSFDAEIMDDIGKKLMPVGIKFYLVDYREWDSKTVRSYFLPWNDDIDTNKVGRDLWTYVHMKIA